MTEFPHIEDFENFLRKRVSSLVESGSPDYEDLLQEGRIGIWEGSQKFNEDKIDKGENFVLENAYVGWVTQYASWHILKCYAQKRWTGMPRRSSAKDSSPAHPLRSLSQLTESQMLPRGYEAPQEVADIAPHKKEILEAVEGLPEVYRNYIVKVYWEGCPPKSANGPSRYLTGPRALEQLKSELSHLETFVVTEG